MNVLRRAGGWIAIIVVGVATMIVGMPRFYSAIDPIEVNEAEAVVIARDALGASADPLELGARLDMDFGLLEWRTGNDARPEATDPHVRQRLMLWRIGSPENQDVSALIAFDGSVLGLRYPTPQGPTTGEDVIATARSYLSEHGFDTSRWPEPTVDRLGDQASVRFAADDDSLGVTVELETDRIVGFTPWPTPSYVFDPIGQGLWWTVLFALGTLLPFLLGGALATATFALVFRRRLRARRAFQVAAIVSVCTLTAFLAIPAPNLHRLASLPADIVIASIFSSVAAAIYASIAFLAMALGSTLIQDRWPGKLDTLHAFLGGRWVHGGLARACLRGVASGVGIAAGVVAITVALGHFGVWALPTNLVTLTVESAAPGVGAFEWAEQGLPIPGILVAISYIGFTLSNTLAVYFALPLAISHKFGNKVGWGVAMTVAAIIFPSAVLVPLWSTLVLAPLALVPFLLLWRWDVLSALLAHFVASVVIAASFLFAQPDPHLAMGGFWCLLSLLPVVAPIAFLGSRVTVIERHHPLAEVPGEVTARLVERERHRLELETAQAIQTSILPPAPSFPGVQIAVDYRPASEIGGDFYHVARAPDGRLALALGDVAGHGVASGLMMSRLHGALSVHIDNDADVRTVLTTLNRFLAPRRGARRRIATLWYGLYDPRDGSLEWAAAGQAAWRLDSDGRVDMLMPSGYPLGVRGDLRIEVRHLRLEPGDAVFLSSDGLVEARSEGTSDPWGYERLDASLRARARGSADEIVVGVLDDLRRFTGDVELDDDRTVLTIRRLAPEDETADRNVPELDPRHEAVPE
ncbi:MAG: PP2C family protein-serine/threonine phosphatase [Acidobacteriota bacterium]